MTITIKTADEIDKMRVAGRLAADVLHMIRPHVQPGVTTGKLDRICHDFIVNEQQAIPAPLNYRGFPKSICTSVNHQVCHGIPGERKLKAGDILNIDITVMGVLEACLVAKMNAGLQHFAHSHCGHVPTPYSG